MFTAEKWIEALSSNGDGKRFADDGPTSTNARLYLLLSLAGQESRMIHRGIDFDFR